MTFNIQHGIDGTSKYNPQRAIDTITRVQPDTSGCRRPRGIIRSTSATIKPARIANGVQAATGQRWEVSYEQERFTPAVSCQTSSRGTGPETEGLVLLTQRSVSSPSMMTLPDSRIGYMKSVNDAYRLPVGVTHLSSGTAKAAIRSQQIDRLLS